MRLVFCEVRILPDLFVFDSDIVSGDPVDGVEYVIEIEADGSLRDDEASAVSDQNFHRDPGILLLFVCQVYDRSCDAVRDLVRMAFRDFLVHFSHSPFLFP